MRDLTLASPDDLEPAALHAIAAAMRAVAAVHGGQPEELALIEAFDEGLPGEATDVFDPAAITSAGAREALLKSTCLVALVDGDISEDEYAVIVQQCGAAGVSEAEVRQALHEVARVLMSTFQGVVVFRDEVLGIGERLGLSADEIASVLDEG